MTDTLTIARDLEASGIDRGQAEAIASAIGKSDPANPSLERVATKGDIDILRSEMRRAFGVLFALILALNGLTLARLFGRSNPPLLHPLGVRQERRVGEWK